MADPYLALPRPLTDSQLYQLKRWNTPTIYNGWEQVTQRDPAAEGVNIDEVRDFMPQMGPMVGYAVTMVIEPSNPRHRKEKPENWMQWMRHVASVPGPKIIVVQDLDKPKTVGSLWGEVSANWHRALGCVGTITDGAVRDVDEMTNAGFKALAKRLCVGHAHVYPVRFDCDVEVFGQIVRPGQLIHADKHGFLAMEPDEQPGVLEAATFMDRNECDNVIGLARNSAGVSKEDLLEQMEASLVSFGAALRKQFNREGEWSGQAKE